MIRPGSLGCLTLECLVFDSCPAVKISYTLLDKRGGNEIPNNLVRRNGSGVLLRVMRYEVP